ncbi:FecR family protein [Methylobacterium sp. SD274]|uniref:FecR family protein n=1 Tax=Methylobacterium sp. SD274 TaxID=2782009 RepID=UPI001A96B026|nr:FecR family protein [Methylobacterium sp. SD274]MBO1020471.1 FecR family protein [Methylobacterium sp. SD274]
MNEGISPDASPGGEDDPVYEAAAFWVVRLTSADASSADRKAFEVWRRADPAHAEAYAEMETWRRTMGQVPDPRERKSRRAVGLSAVVAIAFAGIAGAQLGLIDRLRADAWTGVGEIETRTLVDGSRIDLNTDTAVALRFTAEERAVDLLRGEAVFDVVPDPRRPFIVRGNGVSARAVGTRFYVRVDGAADPVGVAEGRVDVSTAVGHTLLHPGEVAFRDEGDRPVARQGNVAEAMSWRDGKLSFSGQSLRQVIAELERYRRGRILLMDSSVGERRFSGTLDPRDTDEALDVLVTAMGIRVTRLTPFVILVR